MTDIHSNDGFCTRSTPATLATVKHGGCVQLVSSERERFEAWAASTGFRVDRLNDDGYCDERTVSAWLAWVAALSAQPQYITDAYELGMRDGQNLSAQPSPGGQRDALRVIAERLRGAGACLPAPPITGTIEGSMVTGLSIALALVEEALAARHPVGCGACGDGCADRAGCRVAEESPPVGQEPAIWVNPGQLAIHKDRAAGQGGNYLPTRLTRDGEFTKPLYAAPPAQAVELGRWSQRHAEDLEQAIHTALNAHTGSLSQKKRAAISAYVKRLLIDSQAVGDDQ